MNKGKGKRKTKTTGNEDKRRPVGNKGMGKRKVNALDEQPGDKQHADAEIQQVRSKRQTEATRTTKKTRPNALVPTTRTTKTIRPNPLQI